MDMSALAKISYGMYIVSSKMGDKINGQIANVAFQVTSEPPQLAVCIAKSNLTHEFIKNSKVFSVSILSQEADMIFVGRFGFKSGKDIAKYEGIEYKLGITGAPVVLKNTLAYVEVEVSAVMDMVTHTLFAGKIVNAENIKTGDAMTYDYYHKVIKGKSPKAAPTFIKI